MLQFRDRLLANVADCERYERTNRELARTTGSTCSSTRMRDGRRARDRVSRRSRLAHLFIRVGGSRIQRRQFLLVADATRSKR
jgi:hypothetical protein